jgi:hypothetical protein
MNGVLQRIAIFNWRSASPTHRVAKSVQLQRDDIFKTRTVSSGYIDQSKLMEPVVSEKHGYCEGASVADSISDRSGA